MLIFCWGRIPCCPSESKRCCQSQRVYKGCLGEDALGQVCTICQAPWSYLPDTLRSHSKPENPLPFLAISVVLVQLFVWLHREADQQTDMCFRHPLCRVEAAKRKNIHGTEAFKNSCWRGRGQSRKMVEEAAVQFLLKDFCIVEMYLWLWSLHILLKTISDMFKCKNKSSVNF